MLRTRPVNRWPKKAWKSGRLSWRFDSILGRCFPLVFDLEWPFVGHFSSRIPPIKYTKVLGNHLLYSYYYSLSLGSSLETSQELAKQTTWLEEQWFFCSSLKLISFLTLQIDSIFVEMDKFFALSHEAKTKYKKEHKFCRDGWNSFENER